MVTKPLILPTDCSFNMIALKPVYKTVVQITNGITHTNKYK